jgi:hypothetical protein
MLFNLNGTRYGFCFVSCNQQVKPWLHIGNKVGIHQANMSSKLFILSNRK